LNAFVKLTGDPDVFTLLDFYKCYRAMVRIKVNCFRLGEGNLGLFEEKKLRRKTGRFMKLAYRYAVQIFRPSIWVVCGMPASGKSTIAAKLAETLCVCVFRSDVIRKELFDTEPHSTVEASYGAGIYSKEASSLTYGKLLITAQEEIERGKSAILDATFSRKHHRKEAACLARDMDINIVFIECIAPKRILKKRLMEREQKSGISDARSHHFDKMKSFFEPLDEVGGDLLIRVDTHQPIEESLFQILSKDYRLVSKKVIDAIRE